MRYFTRTWAEGGSSPEEADEACQAYRLHIADLMGRVPEPVADLALSVDLHDAIVRRVQVDRQAAGLRVELRCGDQQRGYFDAVLNYRGVLLTRMDLVCLQGRARDPRTEVLYDEVDIGEDGYCCHRSLFWPEGELEIQFSSLALSMVKKDCRVEPKPEDVYSEGSIE